jgi:imidazolonepropionase-like amidohydrolase
VFTPVPGVRAGCALLGPNLTPVERAWMTFQDGMIADMGTGRAPAGLIPLAGEVVLPGLVDCHVHLTMSGGADVESATERLTPSTAEELARANARAQALCGVTTVRDLGSFRHIVVDLAKELSRSETPSPSIVAAGALSRAGGHGHFISTIAAGPDGYASATRELLARGAAVVKVFATGGVITGGSSPGRTQMTLEELQAVVEVAHARSVPVAAHAHGAAGIANAVAAGVDSVEHFSYLEDVDPGLLAGSRTRLVSTLVATERFVRAADRDQASPEALQKIVEHAPHERAALRRAVAARLPLAVGTDAGTTFNPHGWGMQEQAEYLAIAGMGSTDILQCLSVEGALALGAPAGWLEVGRRADLIAVGGDPLGDLRALREVTDVVIRGRHARIAQRRRSAGRRTRRRPCHQSRP